MQRLAVALCAAMGSLVLVPACAGPEDDSGLGVRPHKDSGHDVATDAPTSDTKDTGAEPDDTLTAEDSATDSGVEDTRYEPVDSGDPCTDCVTTTCKTQLAACMADAECSAQMDCLTKCFDEACADACAAAHPSTKVAPFLSCVSTGCATACSGP